MDINTAVLTFQVRREINGKSYPLEISEANTEITAYFVSITVLLPEGLS